MALSPETTTLRKGARVYPFVKSGRLINPYGFDPAGPQRGQWAETGRRGNARSAVDEVVEKSWRRRRWEAKKRR